MSCPVFVIPHYSESAQSWNFLNGTLASLIAQTDPDWDVVIVDDGSPVRERTALLEDARACDPDRVHVIEKAHHDGPGGSRNVGVTWAAARNAPFVLFIDADDTAHPDRLRAVRTCFATRPEVDFIYSTFDVIDEHDDPVPLAQVTPSIQEILRGHKKDPIEGPDQWLRVALDKGYTTHASTVAVRTPLALACPFPTTYVSEDSHTWFRMLAAGTTVGYLDAALACRRICSNSARGSSTRQRFGDDFYWMKLQVDLDGFTRAMELASARHQITEDERTRIRRGFHLRQARTMEGEHQALAAAVCQGLAALAVPEASLEATNPFVEAR